jgi:hypothetical protein
MVKVTLIPVSEAVVEAGTLRVGEMSKVQVDSSPPQGSVSVSVTVVETSEVPVGLIEIVTRVTSVRVEETSTVPVGLIEMVMRVTSVGVEETSTVLVGSTEKVARVTSVRPVEVSEVLPSSTVKVTPVTSATAIKISEGALYNKILLEGKQRLTTNNVNEAISSHTGVAFNCINRISLTGPETRVVGVESETYHRKRHDQQHRGAPRRCPRLPKHMSPQISKAERSTGELTEGDTLAHHNHGKQEDHKAELGEESHLDVIAGV